LGKKYAVNVDSHKSIVISIPILICRASCKAGH
jgi:hypothetical protein